MGDVSPPLKSVVLLHGMFLWTRLVLIPSRGDHYTGCSCVIGWYWFHHEANITRDVPVDSVGTGSITRRPLHGMFLWTRLVLVPSRGDHLYSALSCHFLLVSLTLVSALQLNRLTFQNLLFLGLCGTSGP